MFYLSALIAWVLSQREKWMKLQGLDLNTKQTHGTAGLPPKCTFEISYFHQLLLLKYPMCSNERVISGEHILSLTSTMVSEYTALTLSEKMPIPWIWDPKVFWYWYRLSKSKHPSAFISPLACQFLPACLPGPRINLPGIRLISGPQFYICL